MEYLIGVPASIATIIWFVLQIIQSINPELIANAQKVVG